MEQTDEFVEQGRLQHRIKRARGTASAAEDGAGIDVAAHIMAYLHCMQHMLKLQMQVVNGWIECPVYEPVLMQMWARMVAHSGVLEEAFLTKRVPAGLRICCFLQRLCTKA